MKIYISGKIGDLPYSEVREKFNSAEDLLKEQGYFVTNPLKNGLSPDASWEHRMIKDIKLLMPCDAIYLLENWMDSKGARIEKSIAENMGKTIIFQTRYKIDRKEKAKIEMILFRVESAIQEVTGMSLREYATSSRKRENYFVRLIYIWQCHTRGIKDRSFIGRRLNKDHTTPLRGLTKYPEELKYNSEFRELVGRVEAVLDRIVLN